MRKKREKKRYLVGLMEASNYGEEISILACSKLEARKKAQKVINTELIYSGMLIDYVVEARYN